MYKETCFKNNLMYLKVLGTGHQLREGGGLQNGKIVGPKLFAPPPLKTG